MLHFEMFSESGSALCSVDILPFPWDCLVASDPDLILKKGFSDGVDAARQSLDVI